DALDRGLVDVRLVVEVPVALRRARGAAEVVEGDRVVARGGEALGQLDVEAVEAPDVGQDDDAGAARRGRLGQRGGELVAVGGGDGESLGGGATGDHGAPVGQLRGQGIELEAHMWLLSLTGGDDA